MKIFDMPDNSKSAIVQGVDRVRLIDLQQKNPYYLGNVELEDKYPIDDKVDLAPMISNLKSKSEQIETISNDFKEEKKQLIQLRKYVEKNFDFVGKDFCKKVREIYYDKKNKKAIYGTATDKERRDLADEGIDLLSIPWVNKDN